MEQISGCKNRTDKRLDIPRSGVGPHISVSVLSRLDRGYEALPVLSMFTGPLAGRITVLAGGGMEMRGGGSSREMTGGELQLS